MNQKSLSLQKSIIHGSGGLLVTLLKFNRLADSKKHLRNRLRAWLSKSVI